LDASDHQVLLADEPAQHGCQVEFLDHQ